MRIARAMWAAVLAVCLEIPDVVAQECGSSSDQKVGLVAAGAATDGEGGFTTLDVAHAVSTFERGESTYAIVAAVVDDGIQIVDVSDPSNPVPVSSATDGQGGFTELYGAIAVSTFERGGSTYAIVVAYSDNGIQIVSLPDCRALAPILHYPSVMNRCSSCVPCLQVPHVLIRMVKGIRRSLYRTMTVALASSMSRQRRQYVVLELCAMLRAIRTRQRAV